MLDIDHWEGYEIEKTSLVPSSFSTKPKAEVNNKQGVELELSFSNVHVAMAIQ